LYDGPHSTLQVLPLAVRDSARKIVQEAPALMPEVVDMAREIHRLRDQVAAVQVDGDRRERAALARSESCEQHGREIQELGKDLDRLDRDNRATEAARVALLGMLQAVEGVVRAYRENPSYRQNLTVKRLVPALENTARKVSAAHMRAWKR
jgi:hypothetical protein